VGCKSSDESGVRDRVAEVLALIAREPGFAFTVFEVEEDLPMLLDHFGVHEDLSIEEEFLLKEALVPLAVDAETMSSLRDGSGWLDSPEPISGSPLLRRR